jgi:heat shock protein HslJ
MDQEAALVRALESAERVEVAPGELVILDAEGRITLVAVEQ